MPKEFKFIALSDKGVHFKAGSERGALTGHTAITGNLDEGADIILPGAFKDSIQDFIDSGWAAHSHDWGFDAAVGYLTKAEEDDIGLYVESEFHSTPDAQAIRTKAQERLAAGKRVGLSIGYELTEPAKYLFPKEYEKELPKYVKAEYLDDALTKSSRFSKIRLLSKLGNFEFSIVTAPMNKLAQAASVKAETFDIKGMFEDALSERTNAFHNLCSVLSTALSQLRYSVTSAAEAGATLDAGSQLDEVLAEFSGRVREAFLSKLGSNEYWDTYWYYGFDGRSESLTKLLSVKASVSDKPLDEHSETVVSALTEFAQLSTAIQEPIKAWLKRSTDKQEYRTKEGRTISQATANKITTAKTQIDDAVPALETVSSALSDLLELATPKEKVSPEVANALRTQSLRIQSRAVGVAV